MVLLILAGVSINLVVGNNGIITKARDAKKQTEQATANEQASMSELYDEMLGYLGEEIPLGKVGVNEKASKNSTINGGAASATNPIIPEGYIPIDTGTTSWGDGSSAPTEENVNKGLVIKDESGNEWVWVPVDNTTLAGMYETASTPIELTGGGAITDETVLNPLKQIKISKYSKSITITNNDNSTTTISRVRPNDTSSDREPDVVVDNSGGTSYDAVNTNRATAGFTKTVGETTTTMTLAEMADMMRSEYETMIASIEKYHGFYIGRYELNVNGEEKTGETLTSKTWYYLYNQCKGLSASNKVMSRMIWGCQWDVTCNWIANYGDKKNISDSSTWGNYGNYNTANSYSNGDTGYVSGAGSKQNTGSSEYWKANNIYDFAGNCSEWTQEAGGIYYRAYRGGYYDGSGSDNPASDRGNYYPPTLDYSSVRFSSHFNSATLSN